YTNRKGHHFFMKNKHGFTIVELLIIIVVIAIIATITIVSYAGVQNRAHDSVVQSDLRDIADSIDLYNLRNKGSYPVGDANLQSTGMKVTKNSYGPGFAGLHNLLYCRIAPNPGKYALMAQSKSGTVFIYKSENGSLTSSPTWYGTGSVENCNAVGINQVNGSDRDILKYNGAWAAWL